MSLNSTLSIVSCVEIAFRSNSFHLFSSVNLQDQLEQSWKIRWISIEITGFRHENLADGDKCDCALIASSTPLLQSGVTFIDDCKGSVSSHAPFSHGLVRLWAAFCPASPCSFVSESRQGATLDSRQKLSGLQELKKSWNIHDRGISPAEN